MYKNQIEATIATVNRAFKMNQELFHNTNADLAF